MTTAAETQRRTASAGATGALSLGALAHLAGYHLAQASVATGSCFERHVGRRFGLRQVEFSLLMLLLANGPRPPKRLARTLTLSAPNLTQLLSRLEDRGLIERERNPDDGRSQYIVLSDAGRQLARSSEAAAATMERDLMNRLSRAERAILIELLQKLAGESAPD
jgi:DNA-binding MarR family transcriptional regulator